MCLRDPGASAAGGGGQGAGTGRERGDAAAHCPRVVRHARRLTTCRPDLSDDLAEAGQPAFGAGQDGDTSYVMPGTVGNETFRPFARGAKRVWSRHQALRRVRGE
ncbi:RtcB family protein [Streptomyces sp. CB02130]|uniref:RtcB family protein n=1 Tax=Streptomyces sp. CB02130 TaxID=1703934 RepID=UPI00093BB29C|nr:RtcB family protein [Streptomyces sp. CB02130]